MQVCLEARVQSPLSSAQRQEDSRIKLPGGPKGGRHQYRAGSPWLQLVLPPASPSLASGSSCPEEPSVFISGCATGSLHPLCAGDRAWSTHCAHGALYHGPWSLWGTLPLDSPSAVPVPVGGRREYAQLSNVPGPRIRKALAA